MVAHLLGLDGGAWYLFWTGPAAVFAELTVTAAILIEVWASRKR